MTSNLFSTTPAAVRTVRQVLGLGPWTALAVTFVSCGVGLLSALPAYLLGQAVDAAAAGQTALAVRSAVLLGLGSAASVVLSYLAGALALAFAARARSRLELNLAQGLADPTDVAFLEDARFQDRLARGRTAAEECPTSILSALIEVTVGITTAATYSAFLLSAWPLTAAVLLLSSSVSVVIQRAATRRAIQESIRASMSFRWAEYFGQLFGVPRSAREIRLFSCKNLMLNRLETSLNGALTNQLREHRASAGAGALLGILNALIFAGSAAFAAWSVTQGKASVGGFVFFITALGVVQAKFLGLLSATDRLARDVALMNDYAGIAQDAQAGSSDVDPQSVATSLRDRIDLQDVWFRYPNSNDWVLRGVNLTFHRGQKVALVGENGSGKTTLLQLLALLYLPQRGRILWDGIDTRTLSIDTLRRHITGISQDFTIFEMSLEDNIRLGLRSQVDLDAFAAEERMPALTKLVADLSSGWSTTMSPTRKSTDGGNGVALSGGQGQQVAVSRCLFRVDPSLVLLDEPTSMLDEESRDKLIEAFPSAEHIVITTSHNMATLQDCDRVIKISCGRVTSDSAQSAANYCRTPEEPHEDCQDGLKQSSARPPIVHSP